MQACDSRGVSEKECTFEEMKARSARDAYNWDPSRVGVVGLRSLAAAAALCLRFVGHHGCHGRGLRAERSPNAAALRLRVVGCHGGKKRGIGAERGKTPAQAPTLLENESDFKCGGGTFRSCEMGVVFNKAMNKRDKDISLSGCAVEEEKYHAGAIDGLDARHWRKAEAVVEVGLALQCPECISQFSTLGVRAI